MQQKHNDSVESYMSLEWMQALVSDVVHPSFSTVSKELKKRGPGSYVTETGQRAAALSWF